MAAPGRAEAAAVKDDPGLSGDPRAAWGTHVVPPLQISHSCGLPLNGSSAWSLTYLWSISKAVINGTVANVATALFYKPGFASDCCRWGQIKLSFLQDLTEMLPPLWDLSEVPRLQQPPYLWWHSLSRSGERTGQDSGRWHVPIYSTAGHHSCLSTPSPLNRTLSSSRSQPSLKHFAQSASGTLKVWPICHCHQSLG